MSKCQICGNIFDGLHTKQKFCSKECREAHYYHSKLSEQNKCKSIVIQRVERKVKPKKMIETDADQARIKCEIDQKYRLGHGPAITLERGTPEWDAAVAAASKPGQGRKVSVLEGLCCASARCISMRDNRNEKYVRTR